MIDSTEKLIVALDIGTTKIACIVGRKNDYGKIEILAIGREESHGVMRGMVSNIDKTVKSIQKAVAQAEAKAGIKIKTVHVGIAGQHIRSLQHRGILTRQQPTLEIDQKDINKLVEDMHMLALNPGEKIIHVLPQEYIVDNEQGIKEPIGMCGSRLEANFHIITGQVAAAQNIEKCVNKAGLRMASLILEPLASAAAVLDKEEKEAGVALVDIGGGTTDIAIFQDGIIRHTSVIPFGGNIITDDIKEGCLVMKKQAEALKLRFGSALAMETQENEIVSIPGLKGREPKEISVRNLAHIIQARVEEIFEQVYFEIRSSGYANKLIGGIVLTGGGSQLKHLKQLVEYTTGYDTRIGFPTEHLAQSDVDMIKHPMFATGVGLMINGDAEESVSEQEEVIDQMDGEEAHEEEHFVEDKTQPRKNWWRKLVDTADEFFQEDIN
jgi:cell division protein FtsA